MAVKPPMLFRMGAGGFLAADLGGAAYSQALMLEKWTWHFPQTGRFSSHCVKVSTALLNSEARSEPLLSSAYMLYILRYSSCAFDGVLDYCECTLWRTISTGS